MKHCTQRSLRGYLPEVWGRVSLCHRWCQSPHKGPSTRSRWPAYILNEWKNTVWGGQLAGSEVKQHSGSLNQGARQKSRTAGIGSLCPSVYMPRLLPQTGGRPDSLLGAESEGLETASLHQLLPEHVSCRHGCVSTQVLVDPCWLCCQGPWLGAGMPGLKGGPGFVKPEVMTQNKSAGKLHRCQSKLRSLG